MSGLLYGEMPENANEGIFYRDVSIKGILKNSELRRG